MAAERTKGEGVCQPSQYLKKSHRLLTRPYLSRGRASCIAAALSQKDQTENCLGHYVLDPCYQSHRVMPNMFTASRGQYQYCPCGRVTKDNSLRPHKSFFSI